MARAAPAEEKNVAAVGQAGVLGRPAAGLFDLAGHGGSVALGSPNVLIGSKPAARRGDPIVCALHGSGLITQGSATVFINGMPAARMGDMTGCFVAATAPPIIGASPEVYVGSLDPADKGKTRAQHDEDGENTLAHAEYIKTDANGDGKYDTHDASAQLLRTTGKRIIDTGDGQAIAFNGTFDMARVDGRYAEPTGIMGVATGSAEGSLYRGTGSIAQGKKESLEVSPDESYTLQIDALHGKAERDVVIISDGRTKRGLSIKGELGGEGLKAELTHTEVLVRVGAYDVSKTVKLSVSGGSFGLGMGAWGLYDTEMKRVNMGFNGLVELVAGVGLEADISLGKTPQVPAPTPSGFYVASPGFGPAGIPGIIAIGTPTVLIGG